MVFLGSVATDRNNNLNLIRMTAALAVLVSHAYPIALGLGAEEPLKAWTGKSLGSHAVAVFFVISGYLIAESFARTSSWRDFALARVLRLWPGLLVSLALVAFVMGPIVSSLPTDRYLSDPAIWSFMASNLALYDPQYTLPGVFADLPNPNVEGSIWTLFYEVVCYGGIFVVGCLGLLHQRGIMSLLIVGFLTSWMALQMIDPDLPTKAQNLVELTLPFTIGTAMWLWRDRLPLSLIGVIGLLGLTVALAATPFYWLLLAAFTAYATFWVAYVPKGAIRAYNRLGDYSYGVYIYAFPAQGLAVWLMGGEVMSPLLNIAIALPLTLIPSVLSWHLIEKPSLRLRKRFAARRLKAISA